MASDAAQEVDGPPPRTLVKDLDFKLQAGERWAILGPNGSGKSTIARTLVERWEPWQNISVGEGNWAGYFRMFRAARQPRKKHMVPRQLMFLLISSGMFCRQVSNDIHKPGGE